MQGGVVQAPEEYVRQCQRNGKELMAGAIMLNERITSQRPHKNK